MILEPVSRKRWAHGLYCTCCAKRILNGRNVAWVTDPSTRAICEPCTKKGY